jgi:hypothetical protein
MPSRRAQYKFCARSASLPFARAIAADEPEDEESDGHPIAERRYLARRKRSTVQMLWPAPVQQRLDQCEHSHVARRRLTHADAALRPGAHPLARGVAGSRDRPRRDLWRLHAQLPAGRNK